MTIDTLSRNAVLIATDLTSWQRLYLRQVADTGRADRTDRFGCAPLIKIGVLAVAGDSLIAGRNFAAVCAAANIRGGM